MLISISLADLLLAGFLVAYRNVGLQKQLKVSRCGRGTSRSKTLSTANSMPKIEWQMSCSPHPLGDHHQPFEKHHPLILHVTGGFRPCIFSWKPSTKTSERRHFDCRKVQNAKRLSKLSVTSWSFLSSGRPWENLAFHWTFWGPTMLYSLPFCKAFSFMTFAPMESPGEFSYERALQ